MTVLSGRYELGARLGIGGMGEVFEARDLRLGRQVAVKLLLPTVRDPNARARFVREVEIAATFTHQNVVTVYDVGIAEWPGRSAMPEAESATPTDEGGSEGERPYFVMELVDGRTLAQRLTEGPLAVDEATRIASGMLAGLAAAHAHGLVHRDVKPGNVLLGRNGSVKLTDFGIAKAAHDATAGLTATGQLVGTPAYLAPEQVGGEPVGPATDVYASGVVLYEMLAGAPPFRGDSAIATALAHRQAPVPPLAERRPDVPPPVERVVDRALEKDPSLRFADAETMRGALADATSATASADTTLPHPTSVLPAPVPPARPTAPERRRDDTARRRRWVPAALVGGAIGLVILVAALALSGGDESPRGDPAAASEPTTTSSTSTSTTTIPTPRNLAELAAVLAGNPGGYGPRGPELLEGINDILLGDDEDGDTARQLFDALPDWIAEGEIEPEVGGLAQQYLVPYLGGTGDEGGGGPGKGSGKGKDKRAG